MDKRRFAVRAILKIGLIVFSAFLCCALWRFFGGSVPSVRTLSLTETRTISIPSISRWWDVLAAPFWYILYSMLFSFFHYKPETNEIVGKFQSVAATAGMVVSIMTGPLFLEGLQFLLVLSVLHALFFNGYVAVVFSIVFSTFYSFFAFGVTTSFLIGIVVWIAYLLIVFVVFSLAFLLDIITLYIFDFLHLEV